MLPTDAASAGAQLLATVPENPPLPIVASVNVRWPTILPSSPGSQRPALGMWIPDHPIGLPGGGGSMTPTKRMPRASIPTPVSPMRQRGRSIPPSASIPKLPSKSAVKVILARVISTWSSDESGFTS